MIYEFSSKIHREGERSFIPVPFNVWEETGRRGNIPCRVDIPGRGNAFECKLIPKGGGVYWIPVNKGVLTALAPACGEELHIALEPIDSLTRINRNSPYSREHPVRAITLVQALPIRPGLCGHCCVAMLAGVSVEDVIALMGKEHASWSKILEALDYYGIAYADKAVYPRGKAHSLPGCCIVNNDGSFLLWYGDRFCGAEDVDCTKTVSYIEIFTP